LYIVWLNRDLPDADAPAIAIIVVRVTKVLTHTEGYIVGRSQ